MIFTQVTFEATEDFCQLEHFNVTCGKNEIMMMKKAFYGRMRPGRCISRNYGNLGCAVDVLPYLDLMCSGQQSCDIAIPDPDLHKKNPCPKDFTSYLEVSYQCIKVMNGHDCSEVLNVDAYVSGEGYIIGVIPDDHYDKDAPHCPWQISTSPGQHINLSLINFSSNFRSQTYSQNVNFGHCLDVAVVTELSGKQETIKLCPQHNRQQTAYISMGNDITLYTFNRLSRTIPNKTFLWRYQALGCPNIPTSDNLWIKRSRDHTVIKCNATDETWYLVCQDGEWKGQKGNCSISDTQQLMFQNKLKENFSVPYGILITVAIGVALGIFLGGVLLILVIMSKRYKKQNKKRKMHPDYKAGNSRENSKNKAEIYDIFEPHLNTCRHCPLSINGFHHITENTENFDSDIPFEYQKEYIFPALDSNSLCIHNECELHEKRHVFSAH